MSHRRTAWVSIYLLCALVVVGCGGTPPSASTATEQTAAVAEATAAPEAAATTEAAAPEAAATTETEAAEATAATEAADAPANLNMTGFPIVKEPITLKMMGAKGATQGPWDQLLFFTDLEQRTGIKFEFDTPPLDAYEEKKNLVFASGAVPDVFFAGRLTTNDEITYGEQGVLIPLEELIDTYAPNLKQLMEENPSIRASITAADGHIYALPLLNNVPRDLSPKMWINQQWLDTLGLEMPATTDELYEVLKAFKEKDPNKNGQADEIPLAFDAVTLDFLRLGMLSAFGYVDAKVSVKDDKVVYVPMEQAYKEFLTFMNKLHAEGLVDQESFSQTSQQLTAKGNQGLLGAFSHAGAYVVVKQEDSFHYSAIPPLTSSVNSEQMWPRNPGITRGTYAITSQNQHPEASMRWVDYLYSYEGGAFLSQGPENVGWKWKDAEKTQWEKILPEGYTNTEEFRAGKVSPAAGSTVPGKIDAEYILKLDAKHVMNLDKEVEKAYIPHVKDVYPLVSLTVEEQKRVGILETDLDTYLDQMEAKFITGAEPLANWDQYVGTLKQIGVDELLRIHQAAYDRWKAAR